MKNRTSTWIFFFLFVLTASGVFAAMVENPRQGLVALSVTSQPGSTENAAESHQGLTCIILNPVSVGAFTSKDPIGFNGGMNLYRYADNNPIIYTDPMGLSADDCGEYKDLKINLIHIYNGTSIFPYDRFRIENSFGFVNNVSNFSIIDRPVIFGKPVGLKLGFGAYTTNTNEAFAAFSMFSNSTTEIVNIILAETNMRETLYGKTMPIGGRKALVDYNNGVHMGSPENRSWTIIHETGHGLGLGEGSNVMQQANWGDFTFNEGQETVIKSSLKKP